MLDVAIFGFKDSLVGQFLEIFDNYSLFQKSALRLTSSEKIKFKSHITVTHSDFRFFITEQLLYLIIKGIIQSTK